MKLLKTSILLCSAGLLLAQGLWAQEPAGTPSPVPAKKARHKKAQAQAPASAELAAVESPAPFKEKPPEVKFEFNFYGGFCNFLSQNEKTLWSGGYTAGFWAGYLLDPRAVVGIRMEYLLAHGNPSAFALQYLSNYQQSPSFGVNAGPDLNMVCIVPSLKLNMNLKDDSPVKPYFLFGFGVMNKSVANGQVSGQNGVGSIGDAIIAGYSTTSPMVSFALGLPIQLPDGFKVPVEVETGMGFTPDQNTDYLSFTAGISRDW